MGLTDFSTLKRNTFDQYRSGLPMWGDERLDSPKADVDERKRFGPRPVAARPKRAYAATGLLLFKSEGARMNKLLGTAVLAASLFAAVT